MELNQVVEDNNTLYYSIPKLQKLVHQVPLYGRVLASAVIIYHVSESCH